MAKPLPYNKKNDEPQDAKTTKGLTKAEKAKWEKLDKAHGKKKKPKTMAEDRKIDEANVRKIKAQRKK